MSLKFAQCNNPLKRFVLCPFKIDIAGYVYALDCLKKIVFVSSPAEGSFHMYFFIKRREFCVNNLCCSWQTVGGICRSVAVQEPVLWRVWSVKPFIARQTDFCSTTLTGKMLVPYTISIIAIEACGLRFMKIELFTVFLQLLTPAFSL